MSSTTLEQAIHERWAQASTLEALLPAARFGTGRSPSEALPYATLERARGRTALSNNRGDAIEDVTLRIHVWHDDHDAGRAVVVQVVEALDRCSLTLDSPERVARVRRVGETVTAHDDGPWQWTVEFSVRIHTV